MGKKKVILCEQCDNPIKRIFANTVYWIHVGRTLRHPARPKKEPTDASSSDQADADHQIYDPDFAVG